MTKAALKIMSAPAHDLKDVLNEMALFVSTDARDSHVVAGACILEQHLPLLEP